MVVRPVEGRRDWREFLRFPYGIYRHDPYWAPPLLSGQRKLLDPSRRHPFHAHARTQCFLARRDGRAVGRIAAILDDESNRSRAEPEGFFGFFESIDEQPVADALLAAARQWVRERGGCSLAGPFSPSSAYGAGLLVEGFDQDPCLLMPYNPRYYKRLIESAGLEKKIDLYAYYANADLLDLEQLDRIAERVLRMYGVRIRMLRKHQLEAEAELAWRFYTSQLSQRQMNRGEFFYKLRQLRHFLVPELALAAEIEGRPIGFVLALPDLNQALKAARGRLFPFGWLRALVRRRSIRRLRFLMATVAEPYRRTGIVVALCTTLIRNAIRLGFEDAEMSFVVETNTAATRSLERAGCRRYKTYRVYQWK